MIPQAFLTEWRAVAPWPSDAQIEQDLVLSRALVELFNNSEVAAGLALRGGTALHKLRWLPQGRYSEDIDLVQLRPGPIGHILDAVRGCLGPWLGEPKYKHGLGCTTLTYRFLTSTQPVQAMRLKVEINTRDHFTVLGIEHLEFTVNSRWFSGSARVPVYALDELLGTKLRALYQRKKGRDLYDLWRGLTENGVSIERITDCFGHYMARGGTPVGRAEFESNFASKLADPSFSRDILPLLPTGVTYDAAVAGALVRSRLLAQLPVEAKKSGG